MLYSLTGAPICQQAIRAEVFCVFVVDRSSTVDVAINKLGLLK